MTSIRLREADKVEITILADNYADLLLADTKTAKRLRVPFPNATLGEHGLSCLITAHAGNEKHTVLMDAGISGDCALHNARMLKVGKEAAAGEVIHNIDDVEAVVLSHGHFDHFGGMLQVLGRLPSGVPVIVHPEAFVDRRIKLRADFTVDMPTLRKADLEKAGAVVEERAEASTVADGLIMISGQVERTTDFEKGTPGLESKIDGSWGHDQFPDDQGLALMIKGQGLVVLGGCSHSGIVNIVKHVCRVTGIDRVYAVMGGFHLAGPSEAAIDPTIQALKAMAPQVVVPMHCTGWNAINRFSAQMPEQFVLNSVGTTYVFGN